MTLWTLGDVAHCLSSPDLGPDFASERIVSGICTDTRALGEDSLFVPLVGENFDGHDFAQKAVDSGAAGIVWGRPETPQSLLDSGVPLFQVSDTTLAYQALGLYHKKRCGVRCVAITGSVGKTTTKEFLGHLLDSQYKVHRSRKNFNNDIGVPLTLLELSPEHDVVILEMGMRGRGQIGRLVSASEPEVGLITGIGTSHLELLGSREEIARAKGELLEGLPQEGRAILPRGDEFYELLCSLANAPVICYDAEDAAGGVAPTKILKEDELGTSFSFDGETYRLPLPGRHHLHDLMAALAAGLALGANTRLMLDSVASLSHPEGRAEWLELGGVKFFLDAYNSAPESLRASLGVLKTCEGRRIAVLGDMLELGDASVAAHRAVGDDLLGYGVSRVYCVGPLSQHTVERASTSGVEATWYSSKPELAEQLRSDLRPGDKVLIKASRGLALETIVESLKESMQISP